MTRTAFLAALEQLLAPLPEAERKDALSYYEDYLDAAGPEKEAQAIAELGTPEEVAHKILEEQAPADPSAAPASPARKAHSRWHMVLGGGLAVLIEFLINLTFQIHETLFWSFYPMVAGIVLGLMLIVIAICKPLRESLHRKFFL